MNKFSVKNFALGAALLGASSLATAQVFEFDQVSVVEGTTTVEISWEFTYEFDSGTPVSSVGVDITFDQVILTDVDLTNCIIESDVQIDGCQLINDGETIRLALTNFNAQVPVGNGNGVLVFTIDPGAEAGDVSNIAVEPVSALLSPEDTLLQITPGQVSIIDTDAVLTLTPDSFDFGTEDVNFGAQTADFTIGNDGDNDSLTINSVSVSEVISDGISNGAYTVSNNCDGIEVAPGGSCVVTVTFDPDTAGTFDADLFVNSTAGTESAPLTGTRTATANIVINPPFGPVNLGFGAAGDVLTANGTVSNTGSAAADVSCALTGDVDVFSTDPSPLAATINPGATVDFSLSCALPADAEEGDAFAATLSCDIDGEPAGTHELSCSVSTFEPLPVPTMQAWALALFALLMLLVGGISIRFFRAA